MRDWPHALNMMICTFKKLSKCMRVIVFQVSPQSMCSFIWSIQFLRNLEIQLLNSFKTPTVSLKILRAASLVKSSRGSRLWFHKSWKSSPQFFRKREKSQEKSVKPLLTLSRITCSQTIPFTRVRTKKLLQVKAKQAWVLQDKEMIQTEWTQVCSNSNNSSNTIKDPKVEMFSFVSLELKSMTTSPLS